MLHAVADQVVDDYSSVIDGFSTDVEQVEVEVFSDDYANPAERIYRLKRQVLEFKRAVTPLIAPAEQLAEGRAAAPLLPPDAAQYFRDIHDHVVRVAERVGHLDELLTGVLQANIAQLSMRDNQDMRKMSAVVAILAVPTMIFGLYGMNFEHMPELHARYGYPAVLALTAAVCLLLYRRFRRIGWL